jgi:hypothetical protein
MWAWGFMITVTVMAAFVEVVYIGKQADLDRFVRVAEITAGKVFDAFDGPNTPPPTQASQVTTPIVEETGPEIVGLVLPENEPTDPGVR